MEHPFIVSLTDKNLEELQNTLSDLYGKLNFAHKSGNGALINQIHMVIESYRTEYNKRMDEMINKQNIKAQINIEKGNKRCVMKNVNIDIFYNKVNQTEIKLKLLECMCDMIEDRDWTEEKKKITLNNLKACKILLCYRKLEYLLFKTVMDGNNLIKMIPLIKIKFQENFSKGLEYYQEQLDEDLIDEGEYLKNVNNVKGKYERTMEDIGFFENIVDGWEYRLEDDDDEYDDDWEFVYENQGLVIVGS
jgi:hypothetical protein